MNKFLIIFLYVLLLFSCKKRQERTADNTSSTAKQDILAPLRVTVLTDLHDSLKPLAIPLESMPIAVTVVVPNKAGSYYSKTNSKGEVTKINLEAPINKNLAILQNQKGEPILNPEGKPFIMGNGGKSNFTNFTTDNGLSLDAISCSVMDKMGSLWFGTLGGGVSKYDGESFTNFTTAQGLANNNVRSITEDRTGSLWFGTDGGGVSKYDGKSFTNFTTAQGLANNNVLSIIEDKSGNLWFGTDGSGVSKYDGKSFTNFTTAHGLANNNVWSIAEDKTGNIWFGTDGGGVSKYDGNRVEAIQRGKKVTLSDQQDLKKNINGLLVTSFTNFTTAQGLANNNVLSITEDKNGNLWFGTYGGGVSKYDGNRVEAIQRGEKVSLSNQQDLKKDKNGLLVKSFTNFTTAQGLANNNVWSITVDKTGNLWFGTYGGGVSYYDGKSFTNFTTAQGLANNNVWSITEDKSGNLWFGTDGGGASKYDGKSFINFTTVQGLVNNNVWSVIEDKNGNLWFGTDGGGVSKYDGKSFTNFTTTQGLANNTVRSITEDKNGNLWFGTDGGGVSKYDGNRVEAIQRGEKAKLSDQQDLYKNKNGLLVKSFTNFTTTQGLANNNVWSITEDKSDNLWFGTYGGGVSKYDGKSFTNFTTTQGLANNTVWSITVDKTGNLWFATDKGLSFLDAELLKNKLVENNHNPDSYRHKGKGSISDKLFKSYKIGDGLPDNFVTQVMQMPNGKIAVGTNLGITLFNVLEDYSKLTDIELFNSNTGYPVKDVNVGQNGMYLDSKGIIWAATGSEKTALVRFDYAALRKNTELPTVVIKSIKVKDENICWYNLQTKGIRKNIQDSTIALLQEFLAYGKTLSASENDSLLNRFGSIQFDGITKFHPLPENLVLPYEHNKIAFEFAAIETSRPFLVKYQYMLAGYDKEWSPVTNKSNANFGNIIEGTYAFKLKAQGANGVWSEPIVYTFKVLPPWYRTFWAYTMYVLLFLFALRVFVKWRERRLRMEKEKLEFTVEIRTAELVAEKKEVEKQKKRSEDLLLNILPEEVAEELKAKGSADAKQFDEVTVMFTDFKGFTQISEKLTPSELVAEIHTCFKAFDNIITKYNIEKIKTIGDAYMCAGGLPVTNKTNAFDVVNAAIEIKQFMQEHLKQRQKENKEPFEIRIGVHSGPVVAGIVGVKKFAYDIWGDTVNIAARMESSGEPGKVNISGSTHELVKDKFNCIYRGKIQAKNKGEIDMYFVENVS